MGSFVIKIDCLYSLRHPALTISQRLKRNIIKIATKIFGVMFGFLKKKKRRKKEEEENRLWMYLVHSKTFQKYINLQGPKFHLTC